MFGIITVVECDAVYSGRMKPMFEKGPAACNVRLANVLEQTVASTFRSCDG
jgi:hypothetical protein